MKICLKFDENTERGQEMKRDWESAKAILEQDFEYIYGAPTSLTDVEVFDGLLFCFDGGANDGAGHGFMKSFDDANVKEMLQRCNKVRETR